METERTVNQAISILIRVGSLEQLQKAVEEVLPLIARHVPMPFSVVTTRIEKAIGLMVEIDEHLLMPPLIADDAGNVHFLSTKRADG